MLTLFPELLDWGFFVPFLFRIFLAYYILTSSVGHWKHVKKVAANEKMSWTLLCFFELLLGLLYITGSYVQPIAAIGFVMAMLAVYLKRTHRSHFPQTNEFYMLIGLVSLSLIFLGPGAYAVDLPL